ncbi:MAG: 16S rRNA (adenine(1518)-N(6)/adenine(1519)-N(6))-dimethyltransferase [Gammaproteobacteria bacterium]|nr:16S rRNA (adenine(1518)-N(6)/adenine(1519)-N(6))-dimethyltransferase [Gammaproteobacteria bacterium]|tara:strand:- start:2501 stop:3271 length:771 start_codon:yes stop_codon:yes gene_type:complete
MQAKKRFGQNFLSDKKLLEDLVNLINVDSNDRLLEIGPGKGDLTKNLINICDSYFGIELDKDLLVFLRNKFPKNRNAFIDGDILKLNASEIYASNQFRVVGNIPYNISSPILDWCEKHYEKILDIHFMLQKEFALRCAGNEKTSSYGRLSVICKYLYEVTIIKEVSKEFFNPMPKVDSLFVKFSPKKREVNQKELQNLKKVTRALFNKKRKKISNSLQDILEKETINNLDLNLNLRPDELSLNEYLQISALVKDDG